MQLIRCLLSHFYLNMFRASLCPSSGEQDRVLLHMVFCTGCAGCGCVELHTVHTAYDPSPHNHNQHSQCRTPYTVIHGPVLLMMGIMVPETCWDRSLIINIGLVASCWFISLHPTFHDARSQEPKIKHFSLGYFCVSNTGFIVQSKNGYEQGFTNFSEM